MKLHNEDKIIRMHRMDGMIGLELETHRIDRDGRLAATPHPFTGNKCIDRDFSEDQIEINTLPEIDEEQVMKSLGDKIRHVQKTLKERGELLWPFSNPPYVESENDIKIAQYYGEEAGYTEYREHLARRYSKYKMLYSGIHFNYSFSEDLIRRNAQLDGAEDFSEYKDRFYLNLAERTIEFSWVIVALLAASPVADNSFYESGCGGSTIFTGSASLRCSEHGYWNQFTPVLSYESIDDYVKSISRYVECGLLIEERELYYPVRLKSTGKYSIDGLIRNGVNHIELRMIDLNPFAADGIDIRDATFIKLFIIWLASIDGEPLTVPQQVQAIQNFKNSAAYDWHTAVVTDTSGHADSLEVHIKRVLERMTDFYSEENEQVKDVLNYQWSKINSKANRYAVRVREEYGKDFMGEGLKLALKKQELE